MEKQNDSIVFRRELCHSIEMADTFRAYETLERLGVLSPADDVEMYHGEMLAEGSKKEDGYILRIDPLYEYEPEYRYKNFCCLRQAFFCTDSPEMAQKIVARRWGQVSDSRLKVWQIIPSERDMYIVDLEKDVYELDKDKSKEYDKAISTLMPPLLFDFSEREVAHDYTDALNNIIAEEKSGYISRDSINKLVERFGEEAADTIQAIAARANSWLLTRFHLPMSVGRFTDSESKIDTIKDNGRECLIDNEYIGFLLSHMRIIGGKQSQRMGYGPKQLCYDEVILFDLDHIASVEEEEQERANTTREFGRIAAKLSCEDNCETSNIYQLIKSNPYIGAHELIEEASKTLGYEELYEKSVGVWERFSLKEHTKTVMHLADKNYLDRLPYELIPITKLAILVHDIGKPICVEENGNKNAQKEYNLHYAKDFLEKNNVDSKTIDLIISLIGDGQDLVHDLVVNGNESADDEILKLGRHAMVKYFGDNKKATEDDARAYEYICHIIQICDGAAYTSMGITQSDEYHVAHRNHDTFGRSFHPNRGIGGTRPIRLAPECWNEAARTV